MNRHTKIRIRNYCLRPVQRLFEALWITVKGLFKALLNGVDDAHRNDLFRP